MSESYIEVMVQRKPSGAMLFFKYLLIGLAVVVFFGSFLTGIGTLGLIFAIALGVGAYFVGMYASVEYEYLYLDKEITIDKVLNKAKRKRVGTYQVDKMEILAPLNSYHLDSYRNRQVKELDYSSGIAGQPEKRYAFYYEGSQKIIIEPNDEFIKLVKNVAPRKVFND
ncbi:MAG: hypothetical protein IKR39_13185 [Lachnospiraceae bacterium]|nr:hypothetical protein [Lachnospiraceae bacterium]